MSSISENDNGEEKQLLSSNPGISNDRVEPPYYSDGPSEQFNTENTGSIGKHKNSKDEALITLDFSQEGSIIHHHPTSDINNDLQSIDNLNSEHEVDVHDKTNIKQTNMALLSNIQMKSKHQNKFSKNVSPRFSKFTPRKNRKEGIESGSSIKKSGVQAKLVKPTQNSPKIPPRFESLRRSSFGQHTQQQGLQTQQHAFYDKPPSSQISNSFPIRFVNKHQSYHLGCQKNACFISSKTSFNSFLSFC